MADGTVRIEVLLDDSNVKGGVKNVEGGLKGIMNSAKSGVGTVAKLAGALGLVELASKGIDMVKNSMDGAIDRYDTLNNFPRVMEQIGFDAETSQGAINKLSDGIQGLPTRLDEVASTAQSIAIMTGDLDGAVDTTLALNNAFLASGASTADAQRGLQQYTQMLAKGEVDLQSWRTLQETMPYALRETAAAFGFTGQSATNDFYEALKEGDITMDEFNAKLVELDTAQGGFAETAKEASSGIKTAWTNMQTWVVMGVAKIIEAIDKAFGGVGSIEGAINALKPIFSNTFDFIANAIIKTGEVVRSLRDRFNDFKENMSGLKDTFAPLIAVMEREFNRFKENMGPSLDALKQAWEGLKPILTTIGQILGVVIVVAIGILVGAFTGLMAALGPLINAFSNLISFVTNFVATFVALLKGDLTGAVEYWNNAAEASVNFFVSLFEGVIVFVANLVEGIIEFFHGMYMTLVGNSIIPDMVDAIVGWFNNLLDWLIDIVMAIVNGVINVFNTLKTSAISIWNAIKTGIAAVVNAIRTVITTVFNAIRAVVTTVLNTIRSVVTSVWNGIRSVITSVVNGIRSVVTSVFNAIRSVITSVINTIRSVITSGFNAARNIVSSTTSSIRNAVSRVFNALSGIVSGAMGGVKNAISRGMSSALSTVTSIAGKFKNAGRKIVTSIADGIKGAVGKVTGAIGNVASKIRNFLPFSPAKEGPLRDIMKTNIAGSIAETIERDEGKALKAMQGMTSQLADEVELDLLSDIKGITANSVLSGFIPNEQAVHQSIISNQSKQSKYDDSRVIQLLKQLIDKDGNVYISGEKVGSIVDKEQARRIKLLEGWVAID